MQARNCRTPSQAGQGRGALILSASASVFFSSARVFPRAKSPLINAPRNPPPSSVEMIKVQIFVSGAMATPSTVHCGPFVAVLG
jgi:hypothetical protein